MGVCVHLQQEEDRATSTSPPHSPVTDFGGTRGGTTEDG